MWEEKEEEEAEKREGKGSEEENRTNRKRREAACLLSPGSQGQGMRKRPTVRDNNDDGDKGSNKLKLSKPLQFSRLSQHCSQVFLLLYQ